MLPVVHVVIAPDSSGGSMTAADAAAAHALAEVELDAERCRAEAPSSLPEPAARVLGAVLPPATRPR
ncbi:hypothetical protein ABC795_06335 [Blastococcus sp. HT6-30]|uniref:hypothetical protein n=1 Tax=Blastococcus sp. HT6-30 TaxID=3144843 RepID=UPI003219AD68